MSMLQILALICFIIAAILGLFWIIIMIAIIVTSEQPPKGDKYDGL
jgi:hypothetical protein